MKKKQLSSKCAKSRGRLSPRSISAGRRRCSSSPTPPAPRRSACSSASFTISSARRRRISTYSFALGTHPPMSDEAINRRLEITAEERAGKYRRVRLLNHAWNNPAALAHVGTIKADEIGELSGGLFAMDVDVAINRAVFDYDQLIIVGPVFPHEVVGFSGRQQVSLPRHRRGGHPQLLPLARSGHHQPEDHRQQMDAGAPGGGPCRSLGECSEVRVLHGCPRRQAGRPVYRHARRSMVAGRRPERTTAHRLQGSAVPYRSVLCAADVRRDLGRRQVHVQAGAGRGRRRRVDHLCPAHPRDFGDAWRPHSAHRLPHSRLFPETVGALQARAVGHPGTFDACARHRHI